MEKIKLGNTDIYVTPVGLGVLTIGRNQLNCSPEEGAALVRYAYDSGIRLFDTAQYYETYSYMRDAFSNIDMSQDAEDRPVIASKSLDASYSGMEAAINECLEELGIDHIDIFELHEVRQDPDWDNRSGAWRCLNDYKKKGVISAIGVSTHHVDVVERMAEVPECDIVFPLINYAGLGIRKGDGQGTAEEMRSAIEKCRNAGKGVLAMKAFGGGNLTGTYRKALDYVRGVGAHSVMVGMGRPEEVDDIIAYFEGNMAADYQPDVSKKKIHIDRGDCEGCGSCLERCPNKAIRRNADGLAEIDYDKCLTCGYCAPVCPVRAIIMW